MRLDTSAACMASSAPNPYGQPSAHGSLSSTSDVSGYFAAPDYNHLGGPQSTASTPNDQRHQRHHQQSLQTQHMNRDGSEKPHIHSSMSLASYDGYMAGMSSDSELITSSTAARHHHRPYSSQSRVYHAHPVPRNPTTTARLSSHYSNSAANVQSIAQPGSSNSFSLQQQQQQQQQHQQQNQQHVGGNHDPILSMTSPSTNPMSSNSQHGSISSSGSTSSNYLPAMTSGDSPISPVLMQQQVARLKTGGRQLPQRPFKQSMSIDQHSMGSQYQTAQSSAHSLAHNSVLGAHRNFMGEQITTGYQQTQKMYPTSVGGQRYDPTGQYSESQRKMRHDMEMVEKQAASLNLYGDIQSADLPPTGPARSSSSSSGRHLPNVSANQGSMSLDQQNQPVDTFLQQKLRSHDPYRQHQPPQPLSSVSADWLPPTGSSSHMMNMNRPGGQFKQTVSIDHYPASRRQQQQHQEQQLHQQQQQQQHYSPVRHGQFSAGDHYSGMSSYASSPNHQLIGNYDQTTNQQYDPGYFNPTMNQDQDPAKYRHTSHQNVEPGQQTMTSQEHKQFNMAERSSTIDRPQQHLVNRPKLQHQPSSSSSNSNLSGSLKSDLTTNIDNKQVNSDHQKSISSASSSHHYQHSPQHKLPGHHGKQDGLRRGYTSVTASSGAYGGDFGGSQSALSESGDLSTSQASHSGALNRRTAMRAASPSVGMEPSTSAGPHHSHYHHHSTSSSHGGKETAGMRSESTTGLPNGAGGSSTLTKKSNSATQLSMTGTKKRLGFRKKQVTSFSVHRSEEVAPLEARHLVKQGSSVSEGDSSMSGDSSSRSWSNSNFKAQTSEELASMSFIDGLGKGQMISRQGLASPYLGDIQLSLCDRRGNLEIEIIRAKNLQAKTNKVLPLTYVKLYLVKNRKCLAKAKTTLSNKRTLNPLFQQQITFHEDYHGCILQSIVWGNFGKMDKKNFMGIAQISIDDLELSDTVISWYKLFLPSSLQTLTSKSLRHTLLSNSTESFTTTNNS